MVRVVTLLLSIFATALAKKHHIKWSRTAYFSMSFRACFTSHPGMMTTVFGTTNARKQNTFNP